MEVEFLGWLMVIDGLKSRMPEKTLGNMRLFMHLDLPQQPHLHRRHEVPSATTSLYLARQYLDIVHGQTLSHSSVHSKQ